MSYAIKGFSTPALTFSNNHINAARHSPKKYPLPKAPKKASSILLKKVVRFLRGEKNPLADEIKASSGAKNCGAKNRKST